MARPVILFYAGWHICSDEPARERDCTEDWRQLKVLPSIEPHTQLQMGRQRIEKYCTGMHLRLHSAHCILYVPGKGVSEGWRDTVMLQTKVMEWALVRVTKAWMKMQENQGMDYITGEPRYGWQCRRTKAYMAMQENQGTDDNAGEPRHIWQCRRTKARMTMQENQGGMDSNSGETRHGWQCMKTKAWMTMQEDQCTDDITGKPMTDDTAGEPMSGKQKIQQ